MNSDDLGRVPVQGEVVETLLQGADRIHQSTLPTSRQSRSFPKTMGSYSRFSDSSSCRPSTRKNLESESPCSRCQATTILPLSFAGSVWEESSATISPSSIKGFGPTSQSGGNIMQTSKLSQCSSTSRYHAAAEELSLLGD